MDAAPGIDFAYVLSYDFDARSGLSRCQETFANWMAEFVMMIANRATNPTEDHRLAAGPNGFGSRTAVSGGTSGSFLNISSPCKNLQCFMWTSMSQNPDFNATNALVVDEEFLDLLQYLRIQVLSGSLCRNKAMIVCHRN